MDKKKRIAIILPFAGITGFGLASLNFAASSPHLSQASACSRAVMEPEDCHCEDTEERYRCYADSVLTKDKDGELRSSTSCSESNDCDTTEC